MLTRDRLALPAVAALAVALPLLAGCKAPATVADSPAPAPVPGRLAAVHDPGEVAGTITGACTYRDGGQLQVRTTMSGQTKSVSVTVHAVREPRD